MRVALVYPTYWPYVRRGVERYCHDLAVYLAERGHAVDIITSKPGGRRELVAGRVRTVYLPQAEHPVLNGLHPLFRAYTFGLACLPVLLRGRYDVAHAWTYPYGPTMRLGRLLGGTPYLYHTVVTLPDVPGAYYLPPSVDRWVFERTIRGAARVAVLNHEAAAQVQRGWGLDAIVLQAPVDLRVFRPMAARDPSRPRVLFPSDLSDPRKGGVLLLRAWNLVHRRCPEAELVLAGPYGHLIGGPSIDLRSALDGLVEPSARGTIDVRGPGALTDLPRLYSEAAVTVLPSVDEAFGMVLTESLACGTPVVCGDHGGPAEIVGDAGVGVTIPLASTQDLYRMTRAVQLADAILAAIDLAGHEGIAEQCRAHASQWSLDVIGEKVEAAYTEMMGERQRRGGGLAAIRPRSHAGGSF